MIITWITKINPSMDRLFFIMYFLIILGLIAHSIGNIVSGRFKDRFINGNHKKVTKDEYLLPPVRVCHFTHLICIIGLVFTGFCMRYKILETHMVMWKRHHLYLGIIVTANFIIRFFYAFGGRGKTYKDFPVGYKDLKNTPNVIKYYLFLSDEYPHVAKYASLQKITYNLFWQIGFFQGLTGFCLLAPEIMLSRLVPYAGSLKTAVSFFTVIHMLITWFYIITTTIHVYLSVSEGFPLFKLIMFNVEPQIVAEEK